ncbi:hypothetical protein ABZT47_26015 [Sphaerisporangium sp. NPDC005289]|uniref:hypothetical protein n=1 Tax=Sphaerisporangium sp. NPDC005289 TaxID=3155247 RepID=UPI0033A673A3
MRRRRLAIPVVFGVLVSGMCVFALTVRTGEERGGTRRTPPAAGGPTEAGRPERAATGADDEVSARSRAAARARRGGAAAAPGLPFTGDPRDGGHPAAPTPSEQVRATRFLLADPPLAAVVGRAYAEAAHRPLSSAADLRVRSLVFRRFGCETRRCLQLFVWFPNGEELDIGRVVVDMASGGVRVLKW